VLIVYSESSVQNFSQQKFLVRILHFEIQTIVHLFLQIVYIAKLL